MKSHLRFFCNSLFVAIACSPLVGGAFGKKLMVAPSRGSASNTAQHEGHPVKTKVPGFQVIRFEQVDRKFRIIMLNNYTKNVTAYVSTSTRADAPGYILTQLRDFIIANREADRLIRPGAKTDFEGEIDGPAETHDLTIHAVVFDDLTGDGDQEYVNQVLDKRHGRQLLLDEVLPHLQKLTRAANEPDTSGEGFFSTQLIETKKLVTSLANKQPFGATADTWFGYKAEADAFRLSLEQIDKDFQSGDPQRVKFRTAYLEKQLGNLRNRLQTR